MKFKVGDKVKSLVCITAADPKDVVNVGDKGVVTAVKKNASLYSAPYDVVFKGHDEPYYMVEDELAKRLW